MPIIWSDDMFTDIAELDDSRRLLVEIYNNLEAAKNANANPDDLAGMLRRFSIIGRTYLELEERYLLLYEPIGSDHNTRKNAVSEMYNNIISGLVNYLEDRAPVDDSLLQNLASWVRLHFADTADVKKGAAFDSEPKNTNTNPTQI